MLPPLRGQRRLQRVSYFTRTIRASVRDVEITLALTVILVVMVILLFLRNQYRLHCSARLRPCICSGSVLIIFR
jgi:hypothetical protein